MSKLTHDIYRGWDITIACSRQKKRLATLLRRPMFSAVGFAHLRQDIAHPDDWIDPRPQTISLGEREFGSSHECVQVLMDEIKMLIDALRR